MSTRPPFLVRPIDTVYFGGAGGIAAGEVHHGESVFPPSPWAFQGLIRTQLLRGVRPALDLNDWTREAREARAQLVGGPDHLPPGWQITGPFPYGAVADAAPELWFATPQFLLKRHGKDPTPVRAEMIEPIHRGLSDRTDPGDDREGPLLGAPHVDVDGPFGGWVSATTLAALLTGSDAPFEHRRRLPPFVTTEQRVGLAIDADKGTARDGMLYSLRSLRFARGAGFIGWLEGAFPEVFDEAALHHGVGRAGKAARRVAFEPIPALPPAWQALVEGHHLPERVSEARRFWLVLLSPLRLADAARPLAELPGGVQPVWHGCLLGKPQIIGGFKFAEGRSRANRAYVPAGSAWLFGLKGGDDETRAAALRTLHHRHVLGDPEEARFGFGHTVVGLYEHEEA